MSSPHAPKRARANTAGEAHNPAQEPAKTQEPPNPEHIALLSKETLTSILTQASLHHPDVATLLQTSINEIHEKERTRVIDFQHYSSSIWKTSNITYSRLSGSREYEAAGEVYHQLKSTIAAIVKACGPFSSAGTRFNGLSVLRKIGKTIVLSNNIIGHEIRNDCGWDRSLEEGMGRIVGFMGEEERRRIRDDESEDGLWGKLVELVEIAEGYCIFEGIQGVLDVLEGGEGEGEDGEDDYEEDGHQDQEDGDEERYPEDILG